MNETEAREQGCTCFYSNVTVGRGRQARTWTQLETYNDTCPVTDHNEQATASAQATRAAEGQ